jgi:hypothetical protein
LALVVGVLVRRAAVERIEIAAAIVVVVVVVVEMGCHLWDFEI